MASRKLGGRECRRLMWESQGTRPGTREQTTFVSLESPRLYRLQEKPRCHWMSLSLLSPESCYWLAVYSDECYQQEGSGNKVSGSVADQSTTGENDVILLPVILDEWESNVRKYVVYVCFPGRAVPASHGAVPREKCPIESYWKRE